jgi:hypothetical protein
MGAGSAVGHLAAVTAGRTAATAGRTAERAVERAGSLAARGASAGVRRTARLATPVSASVRLPFAAASVAVPGPGAVATVGPVTVTLPTGALYYGGLAALVAGGALEAPVAAGAAVAGIVLGRRWFKHPVPTVSVYDSKPGGPPPGAAG